MRNVRSLWVMIVLAVCVATELSGPAFAAMDDITVGGVFVCTISPRRRRAHGRSKRIVLIRQRITNVPSVERFRSNPNLFVHVTAANSSAIISVGDPAGQIVVLQVTPVDAMGTGVSAFTLASQWGQKLAQGLGNAMPSSHWNLNYVRP